MPLTRSADIDAAIEVEAKSKDARTYTQAAVIVMECSECKTFLDESEGLAEAANAVSADHKIDPTNLVVSYLYARHVNGHK